MLRLKNKQQQPKKKKIMQSLYGFNLFSNINNNGLKSYLKAKKWHPAILC